MRLRDGARCPARVSRSVGRGISLLDNGRSAGNCRAVAGERPSAAKVKEAMRDRTAELRWWQIRYGLRVAIGEPLPTCDCPDCSTRRDREASKRERRRKADEAAECICQRYKADFAAYGYSTSLDDAET